MLRQIYRHAAAALALHCAHVALLAVFLWRELTLSIFFAWLSIALSSGVWHWFTGRRSLRTIAEGGSMLPDVIAAGIAGLGFGLTALLFPYLSLTTRLLVILMLGAIAVGALPRLSALPTVYLAFLCGGVGATRVSANRGRR
jgi:hypothetical protein